MEHKLLWNILEQKTWNKKSFGLHILLIFAGMLFHKFYIWKIYFHIFHPILWNWIFFNHNSEQVTTRNFYNTWIKSKGEIHRKDLNNTNLAPTSLSFVRNFAWNLCIHKICWCLSSHASHFLMTIVTKNLCHTCS